MNIIKFAGGELFIHRLIDRWIFNKFLPKRVIQKLFTDACMQ